ncbi:uncharacterized protein LOC125847130 [Solanum stenotomum]|uniref:uncharacterized protein LOC125847130 n=1 Tax=Solanum stenotomum TaxID=172797 RepID=UPI0020D081FA|nr:uncharacterized protein LOC125847130 [Solanum stenotomum]
MFHHIGSKPIREIIYQQGGKDGNPPNLATIFFETRKKDNMLVEPEAIEKHAQIEEILKVEPYLPSIEIVEKCCGPQNRSHVFGFGGGVKAKDMRVRNWKTDTHSVLSLRLNGAIVGGHCLSASLLPSNSSSASMSENKDDIIV